MVFWGFNIKKLTLREIGLGGLVFLLSLLTVPALLAIIQLVIIQPALSADPGLGSALTGYTPLSNLIRWGSATLAVAATFFWVAFFRKKAHLKLDDLVMGVTIILFLAAGATSIFYAELSYLFIWPLLFSLLAMAVKFIRNEAQSPRPGGLPLRLSLLAAVVAIVLFVPGALIAVMSIDIQMIYLVPVFIVFLLGYLLSPLLTVITGEN